MTVPSRSKTATLTWFDGSRFIPYRQVRCGPKDGLTHCNEGFSVGSFEKMGKTVGHGVRFKSDATRRSALTSVGLYGPTFSLLLRTALRI